MKLTAWDFLHQDGGEYAEDIDQRHKLIEDAIDKEQVVNGLDLYEKLYELEKAGYMLTFETDDDKFSLEPVCYDILDLQHRRDLLAADIFAYDETDSYDNMQEALDKYEDSLDAGRWAVLAYAIMDGQKIYPGVLPDNEDMLTLKNLEYFMEWASDHHIGEVVSEVAYNMRGDINIRFDHNGLIDMENSKADPEILEDIGKDVIGNTQKEPEKHSKEQHESIKDVWLNGAEGPGDYSNSHVSIQMFIKNFTDADKEHFEDLILQDRDKRRLFGGFEGAFYADIKDHVTYKKLSFDLHKGDFEAAKRLSTIYPDAVVFVNDDWDEHNFAIYKNGEEYNDYTVEWDGDEPEPYRDDWEEEDQYWEKEDQYDIDVKIGIRLPFTDAVHICYSGGGECCKEEFLWYKDQVGTHPTITDDRDLE